MKIINICLIFIVILFFKNNCYAIFGAGDLVYDPANVAQTINVVKAAQSQLDKLGSILGISTNQLDMLTNLVSYIGNSSNLRSVNHILNQQELLDLFSSDPNYKNSNLNALLNSNGILDAFLGMSMDQWILAIENPTDFYRKALINPAINRLGSTSGLSNPTITYTQWYATQTPDDKINLNFKIQNDINDLMNSDWLGESKTRIINLQELATRSKSALNNATNATTLADQQRSQGQLESINNDILIESAAQNASGQQAVLRTSALNNKNLQQMINNKRDENMLILNLQN
jgi:hypothetical protein